MQACCEHWASTHFRYGYSTESSTGRLMRDMAGTNCRCLGRVKECPLCDGTGRVSADLRDDRGIQFVKCTAGCVKTKNARGEFVYLLGREECFRCHGTGRRMILHRAVNPASIKTTVDVGGKHVGDLIYHVVETEVRAWKHQDAWVWPRKVLIAEYFWWGTQEMKGKRMRVSQPFFSTRLRQAHVRLHEILREQC